MKIKLTAGLLILASALMLSCTTTTQPPAPPTPPTDLTTALEQFVIDEAGAYFAGTLTEQQLISEAQAKFGGLALSTIINIINNVLDRPSVINAHTAGVYTTKRPLVMPEKSEIQQTSFQTGVAFAQTHGTDPVHAKALLARRLAYHYRVVASKIKPISDPSFDQGVSSVTGTP